jgi:hypothetical protein
MVFDDPVMLSQKWLEKTCELISCTVTFVQESRIPSIREAYEKRTFNYITRDIFDKIFTLLITTCRYSFICFSCSIS